MARLTRYAELHTQVNHPFSISRYKTHPLVHSVTLFPRHGLPPFHALNYVTYVPGLFCHQCTRFGPTRPPAAGRPPPPAIRSLKARPKGAHRDKKVTNWLFSLRRIFTRQGWVISGSFTIPIF